MAEIKWHPFPDHMPPLPLNGEEQKHYIVTAAPNDRRKKALVTVDSINSRGKWRCCGGQSLDLANYHVIAWADFPDPYVPTPKSQRLF